MDNFLYPFIELWIHGKQRRDSIILQTATNGRISDYYLLNKGYEKESNEMVVIDGIMIGDWS